MGVPTAVGMGPGVPDHGRQLSRGVLSRARTIRPGRPSLRARSLLGLPLTLALLLAGCQPAVQRPSGRVFPLPRQHPDDALAVVNRPRGEGLQIWIDADTSQPGRCQPRWNPDAARLVAGDGSSPRAGGRAPRQEFYDALQRGLVRWRLRQLHRAHCTRVAPGRRFQWIEPPRSEAQFRPNPPLRLEEIHLLSDPRSIRRAEKRLMGQPLTPDDWSTETDPIKPPGP